MEVREVELLSEQGAKQVLEALINALDQLDEEDYFGPNGWREFLDMEGN